MSRVVFVFDTWERAEVILGKLRSSWFCWHLLVISVYLLMSTFQFPEKVWTLDPAWVGIGVF